MCFAPYPHIARKDFNLRSLQCEKLDFIHRLRDIVSNSPTTNRMLLRRAGYTYDVPSALPSTHVIAIRASLNQTGTSVAA